MGGRAEAPYAGQSLWSPYALRGPPDALMGLAPISLTCLARWGLGARQARANVQGVTPVKLKGPLGAPSAAHVRALKLKLLFEFHSATGSFSRSPTTSRCAWQPW
jgi:hypothetical protein